MTEAAFPPPQPVQLELDLEFATYDHYTITIAKGAIGDMEVVRTHKAKTSDQAVDLVEGLRDTFGNRENVQWQHPEVDEQGVMYGLAPGGVVFEISVVPTLNTPLS
jgi:hypothetical protein